MKFSSRAWLLFSVVLILGVAAPAVEKSGYQYDVQKTVIDRGDTRTGGASNLSRLTGLKVSLKNVSFKPRAEAEIVWEILNRKHNSTSVELTSGKEKLPAMRAGEKIELTIGQSNVMGYRYGAITYVDELEWQITILREGKEELKVNSVKSFDTLLRRAVKVELPPPAAAEAVKP